MDLVDISGSSAEGALARAGAEFGSMQDPEPWERRLRSPGALRARCCTLFLALSRSCIKRAPRISAKQRRPQPFPQPALEFQPHRVSRVSVVSPVAVVVRLPLMQSNLWALKDTDHAPQLRADAAARKQTYCPKLAAERQVAEGQRRATSSKVFGKDLSLFAKSAHSLQRGL